MHPSKDQHGPASLDSPKPTASAATVGAREPSRTIIPAARPATQDSRPRTDEDALAETIRRWAKPSTLDELRARGVQRVRSVSMSRMAALLEKAVNRALIQRTLSHDGDPTSTDALALSSNAREEFLRLTRAEVAGGSSPFVQDAAGDPQLHGRATSTLDRLRRELERRRRELGDQEREAPRAAAHEKLDAEVGERIAELFAVHAGVDDRMLEAEVKRLVLGEMRSSRDRVREAQLAVHRREIGLLERRIAKLSALLGRTEEELRSLKSRGSNDAGVGSVYDAVQGLADNAADYERKSTLMRTIFEANLALRAC